MQIHRSPSENTRLKLFYTKNVQPFDEICHFSSSWRFLRKLWSQIWDLKGIKCIFYYLSAAAEGILFKWNQFRCRTPQMMVSTQPHNPPLQKSLIMGRWSASSAQDLEEQTVFCCWLWRGWGGDREAFSDASNAALQIVPQVSKWMEMCCWLDNCEQVKSFLAGCQRPYLLTKKTPPYTHTPPPHTHTLTFPQVASSPLSSFLRRQSRSL